MADAATAAGVGVFLLISSDKAVRPTNVMGDHQKAGRTLHPVSFQKATKNKISGCAIWERPWFVRICYPSFQSPASGRRPIDSDAS